MNSELHRHTTIPPELLTPTEVDGIRRLGELEGSVAWLVNERLDLVPQLISRLRSFLPPGAASASPTPIRRSRPSNAPAVRREPASQWQQDLALDQRIIEWHAAHPAGMPTDRHPWLAIPRYPRRLL
jgi:hypothetical protein